MGLLWKVALAFNLVGLAFCLLSLVAAVLAADWRFAIASLIGGLFFAAIVGLIRHHHRWAEFTNNRADFP